LHDIDAEAVLAVGRTGSGKSTLTLALLRAILVEGSVYYDGVKTSSVSLATLRSKITIIPQVVRFVAARCKASLAHALQPELVNGTIRHNLDMFEEHDDGTLNDALHSSGLFLLQEKLENRGLNLDTQVAAGGANLSIGQRQVLGEARSVCCCSPLIAFSTGSCDCTTEQTHHSRRGDFCHR
jgi:ABC-type multidrug transport system fused ATPase/permease subunit